jgi:hypothetical protein
MPSKHENSLFIENKERLEFKLESLKLFFPFEERFNNVQKKYFDSNGIYNLYFSFQVN